MGTIVFPNKTKGSRLETLATVPYFIETKIQVFFAFCEAWQKWWNNFFFIGGNDEYRILLQRYEHVETQVFLKLKVAIVKEIFSKSAAWKVFAVQNSKLNPIVALMSYVELVNIKVLALVLQLCTLKGILQRSLHKEQYL